MDFQFFDRDNSISMLQMVMCHRLKASVDGDSAYAMDESLAVLIQMIGKWAQFEIPMLRSHHKVMSKSRFSIQCKFLIHNKLIHNGKPCGKVGLHRFPNIVLFHFRMGDVPNVRGTIFLVLTNVPYLRNTSFLYREEQAFINACLNEAIDRLLMDEDHEYFEELQGQFSRMNHFYARVRGDYSTYLTESNSLASFSAMYYLARSFDEVMLEVCSSDDDDFKFDFVTNHIRNGMNFDIDEEEPLKRAFVLRAVDTFSKGVIFNFSLPGFKHIFKTKPEFERNFIINPRGGGIMTDDEKRHANALINGWVSFKASQVKEYIKEHFFAFPRNPMRTFRHNYYIDIGVEFTPLDPDVNFVCNKNGIRNMFREISRLLSTYQSSDISELGNDSSEEDYEDGGEESSANVSEYRLTVYPTFHETLFVMGCVYHQSALTTLIFTPYAAP